MTLVFPVQGRPSMLITLSGLDGAGKSTLAEALKENLEKDDMPAVVFHMNEHVGLYAYLRTVRDSLKRVMRLRTRKAVGERSSVPGSPLAKKPSRARSLLLEVRRRIIWNKALRRWIDLGDLVTFLIYRLYIEKLRGRVLIMDRYFYDRLADIADGRRWGYLRWFARVAPVPDVAVLVEVSPEEAYARKGEYSVESMTRRRATYGEIFSWVPGSVILANDDLNRATRELESIVFQRLSARRQRSLAEERSR